MRYRWDARRDRRGSTAGQARHRLLCAQGRRVPRRRGSAAAVRLWDCHHELEYRARIPLRWVCSAEFGFRQQAAHSARQPLAEALVAALLERLTAAEGIDLRAEGGGP